MSSTLRSVVASVGIGAALMLTQTTAVAGPGDVEKSGASFWQWALSIPPAANPLLDPTNGDNCMVGQSGGVWYLGGTFYPLGPNAERNCSVPAGTAFFVAAINFVNIDTPNVCGSPPTHTSVADLRAAAAAAIDTAANVSITLDSHPVNNLRRSKSGVFAVTLPDSNLFDGPCIDFGLGDVPGGVYSPAIDDGYYAQVNALSPGQHTLHIYAENPAGTVAIDVTYHLNVVATINH